MAGVVDSVANVDHLFVALCFLTADSVRGLANHVWNELILVRLKVCIAMLLAYGLKG